MTTGLVEQAGKQIVKEMAWSWLSKSAMSSAVAGIVGFLSPILIPLAIVLICGGIVFYYVDQHSIKGGYSIVTGQFDKLLIDAVNGVVPSDTAVSSNDKPANK